MLMLIQQFVFSLRQYIILEKMKNSYPLILILTLSCLTHQIHHIYQLNSLSQKDLDDDDLIQVDETSNNKTDNLYIYPNYYIIRATNKQKKYAYLTMQTMFKNVVRILIKNRLIPKEDSLVKSRIKPQYLSKKRSWSFSIIFVIFGSEQQLQLCEKQFSRIRVQRLKTKPSINFLNEKVVALEVFNSAKKKLTRQLQKFQNFQIIQVVDIQIRGAQVQNSDIIEMQLQQEFNESQEVINENQIIEGATQTQKNPLSMKIIFRVGRLNQQNSQDLQYSDIKDNQSDDQTDQSQNSDSL